LATGYKHKGLNGGKDTFISSLHRHTVGAPCRVSVAVRSFGIYVCAELPRFPLISNSRVQFVEPVFHSGAHEMANFAGGVNNGTI
jgi:hypothetical protein